MTYVKEPLTRERLEKAGATAKLLVEQSVIASRMVRFRIECLRLLMLADSVIGDEVKNGWNTEEAYVLDTLKLSASEYAMQNPISIAELHRNVQEVILPIMDILVFQEES